MKFAKNSKFAFAAVAAAVLVACGGGGSGSSAGNTNNVTSTSISGVATKGPIIGGTATLYKANGFNPDAQDKSIWFLAEEPINEFGKYEFVNIDYTGAVVIEITPGEEYYDEEWDESTGQNKKARVADVLPVGQKMYSFVPSVLAGNVTGQTSVQTSLQTSAAFDVVKDFLLAEDNSEEAIKKKMDEVIALDPEAFSVPYLLPFDPESEALLAAMSDEVKEKMVERIAVLTGVAEQMKSGECKDATNKFDCVKEKVAESMSSAASYEAAKNVYKETGEALLPDSVKDIVKDAGGVVKFSEEFIAYLNSDSSLLKVYEENLTNNYEHLLSSGTYQILQHAYSFLNNCEVDSAAQIFCEDEMWVNVNDHSAKRSLGGGYEITVNTSIEGDMITAVLAGSTADAQIEELKLVFSKNKLAGKKWFEKADEVNKIAVNSTFVAKNSNNDVTIEFDVVLQAAGNNLVYVDGSANLASENGDKFTGDIEADVKLKETTGKDLIFAIDKIKFTSDESGELGGKKAKFSLSEQSNYTPANYSAADFDAFNIFASINIDGVNSPFTLQRLQENDLVATVKLGAVDAVLKATAATDSDYCVKLDKKFCFNTIEMKSAGKKYSANYNLVSNTGAVFEGANKVGEISGGKVKLDGTELSFK